MTLLQKLQALKKQFEDRQKKIDKLLDNTNKMMIAHKEGMEEFGKAMKTMERAIESVDDKLESLMHDYITFREKLKRNRWLKLFGIR